MATGAASRPLLPHVAESESKSTRRATVRKLGATVAVILLGLVVVAVSAGTRAVAEGENRRVELDAFPEGEMETRFGVPVHVSPMIDLQRIVPSYLCLSNPMPPILQPPSPPLMLPSEPPAPFLTYLLLLARPRRRTSGSGRWTSR